MFQSPVSSSKKSKNIWEFWPGGLDFLQVAGLLIILFLVFYVLHIGASFIIPFIVALLFSFAILGLSNLFKKFKIPSFFAMIFSLATYVWIFWLVGNLINANIQEFIYEMPKYQSKLIVIIDSFFQYTNIEQPRTVAQYIENLNLQSIFLWFGAAIATLFSKIGLIMFYVLFILLEHRYFAAKLTTMIRDGNQEKRILSALHQIKNDVKSYFVIKTWVSFVTGTLSYSVLLLFWVDFALFWAFLIFVFNFVPTIGSVVAVLFPVTLALVQFDSYYSVAFLTMWLAWVQVLMWNILEPRFVGNKLNLSPLFIILSLWFWGYIWWVIGMLLSVPIMVIINIILSKFQSTRPIAVLFSEKWDLKMSIEETEQNRKELVQKIKKRLFF